MSDVPRRWLYLKPLRSVASVFCFTLCVAFLLLWLRSYWRHDALFQHSLDRQWQLTSWEGIADYWSTPVEFFHFDPGPPEPLTLSSQAAGEYRQRMAQLRRRRRGPSTMPPAFYFSSIQGMTSARAPFWLLAGTTAFAAIVLKPKPRYRFSLFDFLVLTTFGAVMAALVAGLVRIQE